MQPEVPRVEICLPSALTLSHHQPQLRRRMSSHRIVSSLLAAATAAATASTSTNLFRLEQGSSLPCLSRSPPSVVDSYHSRTIGLFNHQVPSTTFYKLQALPPPTQPETNLSASWSTPVLTFKGSRACIWPSCRPPNPPTLFTNTTLRTASAWFSRTPALPLRARPLLTE